MRERGERAGPKQDITRHLEIEIHVQPDPGYLCNLTPPRPARHYETIHLHEVFMKNSPEKPRALALLLSLPVQTLSVPVFAVGAFLVAFGGLEVAQFFLGAAAAGALGTYLGLRRTL